MIEGLIVLLGITTCWAIGIGLFVWVLAGLTAPIEGPQP